MEAVATAFLGQILPLQIRGSAQRLNTLIDNGLGLLSILGVAAHSQVIARRRRGLALCAQEHRQEEAGEKTPHLLIINIRRSEAGIASLRSTLVRGFHSSLGPSVPCQRLTFITDAVPTCA